MGMACYSAHRLESCFYILLLLPFLKASFRNRLNLGFGGTLIGYRLDPHRTDLWFFFIYSKQISKWNFRFWDLSSVVLKIYRYLINTVLIGMDKMKLSRIMLIIFVTLLVNKSFAPFNNKSKYLAFYWVIIYKYM